MRRTKIIRLVLGLGAGFLLLEVAARLYVDREPADNFLHPSGYSIPPSSASNYVPHPFTSFALNPEHSDHNSQGLRARREYGERTDVPRVVIIGGSNVYGTQVRFEDTISVRLEQELEGSVGTTEIVNGGVGAYSTANLIPHLSLRLLDLEPDICLIDVGYTDMVARILYAGFQTDYSHDYKSWYLPERPLWRRSVLLDRVARRLGHEFLDDPDIHFVCQKPVSEDFEHNFRSSANQAFAFERNLKTLIGICRAHGVVPVVCTQASTFGIRRQELHSEIWQVAMEEANASIRHVSDQEGVLLIDIDRDLSDNEALFADCRRMNGAGNQKRARIIAQALVNEGLLKPRGKKRPK